MTPIQLSHFTAVSALGYGIAAHYDALLRNKTPLRPCDYESTSLQTYIGRVNGIEDYQLPAEVVDYHSRNNLLAYAALQQDAMLHHIEAAKQKYGANRIGILLGTTTSGFSESESAYKKLDEKGQLPRTFDFHKTAHPFATAQFMRRYLGLSGPAMTIATACSSSAKTFITAHHWLELNLCDAVIVAGIDSLCLNVLYGFNSLGILSSTFCKPFAKDRAGLSLGEAAAIVLLERQHENKISLLGYGESSDGYHMSSPHPQGQGAFLAMQQALAKANLTPQQIDYINFHGTASQQNDAAEDYAVHRLFSNKTPASSTKGWTGHTLGAAGALETIIACLAIQNNTLFGTLNTQEIDHALQSNIILENQQSVVKTALINSFGFGGNNCSLIIGEVNL